MSSTPTLFNSGTRRSQLSSCYLTTVADDLDGIYEALKENALLSKFAGGLGNDVYQVGSSTDVVVEDANGGTDTVFALASFILPANVEIGRVASSSISLAVAAGITVGVTLAVSSGAFDTLIGGGGDDTLWGGGGGDHSMRGGDGQDTLRDQGFSAAMAGNAGDDIIVMENAASTVTELAGEGTDTVWTSVNGTTMAANVEILRLVGDAHLAFGGEAGDQIVASAYLPNTLFGNGGNDSLYGSLFGDVLYGGAGDDVILGQGGADTIAGGAGNDWMVVTDQNSVIVENAGEGRDRVVFAGTFGNLFIGENVEEGQLIGSALAMTGNSTANVLFANASGVGSSLSGGGGGLDVFVFDGRSAWGNDEIFGFSSATNFGNTGGSKLVFTDLKNLFTLSYAYGQGNTYITSGSNPEFGIITVHGVAVQSYDVISG